MKECNQVYDLRSALERLRSIPGQLVETDVQVDPAAELAGVYRHVGAGGTVMRPTRSGPAMLFNQIKGHPGARVAIGLLADRRSWASYCGTVSTTRWSRYSILGAHRFASR